MILTLPLISQMLKKVDIDMKRLKLPRGWQKAFGNQMYDELEKAAPEGYKVGDVKEKWGMLDVFDWHGNDETDQIIKRYVELSKKTCIYCGKPATRTSLGWISPFCDRCGPEDDMYEPI